MHLKVFLLLALVLYLCCVQTQGDNNDNETPPISGLSGSVEPPNSEETSTASPKETSTEKSKKTPTEKSKKTSTASPKETSTEKSKKTSPRWSKKTSARTSTRRPTPSRTTLGWSDENYDVHDSRSPGRYYGSGYGEDRYDNDRDGYGNGRNNDRYDDDDEENYDVDRSRSPRRKRIPDEYGNMNIYVRDTSSKYGQSKKYKKMRFPVNRFKPGHFPPLPPLISFFPWLPIFADRLTKQTIIFSPTGGLYIIPPVINFYGKLFSVAELIASGYASLVSTGAPPPPAINVAPLVRPGAVAGPGIPPTNTATGGFSGGVQTSLGSVPSSNSKPAGSKGSYGY